MKQLAALLKPLHALEAPRWWRRVVTMFSRPRGAATRPASKRVTEASPARRLRSAASWMELAALLGGALIAMWLVVAAIHVRKAAHDLDAVAFAMPTLDRFVAELGGPKLQPRPRGLDLDVPAEAAARLEYVVRQISQFENGRAEDVLRGARSVVHSVVPDSMAARAGLQAGDVIVEVGGVEAGYVWDTYKLLTDDPRRKVAVRILRSGAGQEITLDAGEGDPMDIANVGVRFAVPGHTRFIGRTDVKRISSQLKAAYLDAIPAEWRGRYTDGLVALSGQLVSNIVQLSMIAPDNAAYVRVEDLLAWYHRQFERAAAENRLHGDRARTLLFESLASLATTVGVAALFGLLVMAARAYMEWGES